MFSTIVAIVLAATQAQPQTQPAGWELLVSEVGSRVHYEPASVRSEGGDRVSVRARISLDTPEDQAGTTRFDIRHLYDCGDRSIAYLSVHTYNAQGGSLLSREASVADAALELQPFAADSIEAELYARVCRAP